MFYFAELNDENEDILSVSGIPPNDPQDETIEPPFFASCKKKISKNKLTGC